MKILALNISPLNSNLWGKHSILKVWVELSLPELFAFKMMVFVDREGMISISINPAGFWDAQ